MTFDLRVLNTINDIDNVLCNAADFGFARFLEDGVMAATLCGSPMYMVNNTAALCHLTVSLSLQTIIYFVLLSILLWHLTDLGVHVYYLLYLNVCSLMLVSCTLVVILQCWVLANHHHHHHRLFAYNKTISITVHLQIWTGRTRLNITDSTTYKAKYHW